MQRPAFVPSRSISIIAVVALIALLAAVALLRPEATLDEAMSTAGQPTEQVAPATAAPPGSPWRYGRTNARYTVVEYADLECPYCRAYFPVLKRWIDAHPEVNLQWHHLPLSMHEPAASQGARLVECVGEAGGSAAFWQAVEWVYTHTRGDGQGLPEGSRYPGLSLTVRQCLESDRPDTVVRAQAAAAAQANINATPTLRLQDRESGRALLLHGPVEGDALLSAIDLLAAGGVAQPPSKEMPAEPIGDMPR